MSRPLYRGFSGGGRTTNLNAQDVFDDELKPKDHNGNGLGYDLSSPMGPGRTYHSLILALLKLGLAVIILAAISGLFYWTVSMSSASQVVIHRSYRRLQEQLVADLADIGELSMGVAKSKDLEFCPQEHENYVPCYYNMSESLDSVDRSGASVEYERKCVQGPDKERACLVLPPKNYRIPMRWPTGRDFIWKENVKISGHEFSSGSLTKRMMVEEEQISFRSDSLMVDGVEDYSHQIAEMVGLRNESNFNEVRTVLDIGCGFGSFGAHLFSKQLLTMCIANYEPSGSQVQLTLERGLPAMIGLFASKQLPFPFLSFDMLHCARCGIDWEKNDGIFLVEVDRLLRPGGYFVWTSVTNTHRSLRNKENQKKWTRIHDFAAVCRALRTLSLDHGSPMYQRVRVCCYCDRTQGSAERRPGPLDLYRGMVKHGKLQHDIYQEKVAFELEDLLHRLEQYEKEMEEYHVNLADWENNRETERRKLLLGEAKLKEEDGVWTNKNSIQSRFFDNWFVRRRHGTREPGVGKMVSYLNREKKLDSAVGSRPIAPIAPKGIYLYGNVGSGKTMLMDMFYCMTEGIVKHRRRFHFHEAMLEIHEHMHDVWKNQVEDKSSESSIINWISNLPFDTKVKEWLIGEEKYKEEVRRKHILPAVADKFLVDRKTEKSGASILCFDEIQTVDVFAIVALSGIVSRLLSTGTVLVATSNRAPEDLNQDGMQRDIFQTFLAKLEENCQKILVGSEIDYRRLISNEKSDQIYYFWPGNSDANKEFEAMWNKVTKQYGGKITSTTIPVMFGRALDTPESCSGVARFDFEYLCGRPVGAADYIAISRNYHTVFISNVPVMSMRIRDKARRFITLVDELYNHHCCLVCLADSSIDNLFEGTDEGTLFDLESFQFETEAESSKLRQDVLAAGSIGSGPAPAEIASLLSGQEEKFAFKRAVSRLIEMQTPLHMERVQLFHPLFQKHSHRLPSRYAVSQLQLSP